MRIGVVGSGVWGINHVKTLREMGLLGVVVEVDANRRAEIADMVPGIAVVDSIAPLVENPALADVSAIVVATPAETHAEIAESLFALGLHVLVEKPMALSVEDGLRIVRASEKAGKVLLAGHLLLHQPAVRFMAGFLREGGLGVVRNVNQRRAKLGRARSRENVMWSFGVHDIAVILDLVSESPIAVRASGYASLTLGVEDDVHLHLKFPGGIDASLHTSWLWPRAERRLVVSGDLGMLEYDELAQTVTLHRKWIVPGTLENFDSGAEILFEGAADPLKLELHHFLDCCEGRAKPIGGGVSALEVIKVLERADESLAEWVMDR